MRIHKIGLSIVAAYVVMSLVLIGVGLLLTHVLTPVTHWDDHVNDWFATHRSGGWDQVSRIGTFIANTMGVVVVAVVVTAWAIIRRWGRVAALLACGLALELATFLTVNYVVARPRPSAPHLGSTPSTYSFPSGHVAATFVLYGGIAVLVAIRTRAIWARAVARAAAAVLTSWVAFARMYEAQHHPTDVMAGLVMGVAALTAVVLALRLRPAPVGRPTDEAAPVERARVGAVG